MKDFVDSSQQRLYVHAINLQDQYWEWYREHNKDAPKEKQVNVGVYVRFHNDSIEIHWKKFKNAFDGKGNRLSEYIRKGRSFSYTRTAISEALKHPSSVPNIFEYENQFAKIREASNELKTALRAYKKAQKKLKDAGLNDE